MHATMRQKPYDIKTQTQMKMRGQCTIANCIKVSKWVSEA